MLSRKKEFWSVLESIEKIAPEAAEITTSVREMPNIKYVGESFVLKMTVFSIFQVLSKLTEKNYNFITFIKYWRFLIFLLLVYS